MGQAVAERTVLRKYDDGAFETWRDVAHRVALGNSLLVKGSAHEASLEYKSMYRHLLKATLLLSGRHLQHGDEEQPTRNKEIFTNCCSAATSFLKFYMLMNGSGVGRCLDDDMIMVNVDYAPALRVVLDHEHKDFDWLAHESSRDALHKYGPNSRGVVWFRVPDDREGWAKALEKWEVMAFEKIHRDKMLILDFSDVRPRGTPIRGMQNRPAAGPVPLMNAFQKSASIKGAGLEPWKQAMYIDHYFSECVLVGGARRAASITTKTWRDASVIDFIRIKRPIEFEGKSVDEIAGIRRLTKPLGFLWSSNNSVTVDEEFWSLIDLKRGEKGHDDPLAKHARRVFREIMACSYADGTGEPGIINVDRLVRNDAGMSDLTGSSFAGGEKYRLDEDTELLMHKLLRVARRKRYAFIVNPCGEIALFIMGGYCTVGTVVPYHADSLDEAEGAFRVCTRALMRVNQMDSVYNEETARTQRIGVSMTGIHEFAWKFFGLGFRDLIDPDFEGFDRAGIEYRNGIWMMSDALTNEEILAATNSRVKAAAFWHTLGRFNAAVIDEAETYAKVLGVSVPHTALTGKPEGTIAKLFGLTEGWHLPPMGFYKRWVQFRYDDPLVATYEAAGYPTRRLKTYEGTTIVGFPTTQEITGLGMGDHLVMAYEVTPDEHYRWLRLAEEWWLVGKTGKDLGNQISYTLHYDPEKVDFRRFVDMMRVNQRTVRCCTVMPWEDASSYEYTPEEAITREEYVALLDRIQSLKEDVDKVHVECPGGACPIDWNGQGPVSALQERAA